MVIRHEHPDKWECPYCGDKYDTKEEAYTCAEECHLEDLDEPISVDGRRTEFECEYCKKMHHGFSTAEECEEVHIENKDKYYDEYERQKAIERLKEAASHPDQIKLMNFTQ